MRFKNNKDLNLRKKIFGLNFNNLKLRKKHDLIFCGKINKYAFSYLQEATKMYLLSCLVGTKSEYKLKDLKWNSILKRFSKKMPKNITHNGLVVPKKENSLEFNLFLKSFNFFITSSGLQKKIKYFIGPPQLRIKKGSKKNLFRPNSSEYLHSDAWTKINTKSCITLFLPINGDCKRNFVEFFIPNNKFSEKWLNQKYFFEGEQLVKKNYKKISIDYSLNNYILADCAILHKSNVKENSGPRVSLDIGFIPYKNKNFTLHNNHLENRTINEIGMKKLIVYNDSFNKKIKIKKSGTNTQSNRRLISF